MESVNTMASLTSVVPGHTNRLEEAVIVSTSAGPQVVPPVTVTVIAVRFVPLYVDPASTKKQSLSRLTCRVAIRSTYRTELPLTVRLTMTYKESSLPSATTVQDSKMPSVSC